MHPTEMQEVRVRFSVQYEAVVLIPKPDGSGDDTDGRREAMLEALDALNIPENEENTLVDGSFTIEEFTDPKTDKPVCRELQLTGK